MIRYIGSNTALFVGLLCLQFFLSLIHFTPLDVTPHFYILFVLLLPFETPGWVMLFGAFLLGLGVDWNNDSFGQHALSTVFIAGMRPLVLNMIAERDGYEKGTAPRLAYFGISWALRYALLMTAGHSLVFYSAEAFSFGQLGLVLAKSVLNTVLTVALIIGSQYWFFRKVG